MPVSYSGLLYPVTQPATPPPYQRPSDWLVLPTLLPGGEKFVGLFPVYDDDGNFLAIYCEGDYVVDWGDGAIDNFASGETAEHTYDYASVNPSTLSERGYRQVIVTVTPQNPGELNLLDLSVRHTNVTSSYSSCPWLEIGLSMPNASNGGVYLSHLRSLEIATIYDTGGLTSMYDFFYECDALKKAEIISIPNVEDISYLFDYCESLSIAILPELPIYCESLFYGCGALDYVYIGNLGSPYYGVNYILDGTDNGFIREVVIGHTGTDLYYLLENVQVESITIEDASLLESAEGAFYENSTLKNLYMPPSPNLVDASYMFEYCYALENVQFEDLSSLETADSIFYECYSLRNVDFPSTPMLTSLYDAFDSCYSLEKVAFQNLSSLGYMDYAFDYCSGLRDVYLPLIPPGVSAEQAFYGCYSMGTLRLNCAPGYAYEMFYYCTNLVTLGIGDASLFNELGDAFYTPYLSSLRIPGVSLSFSVQDCTLSREALVLIFQDLATISPGSQTVNVAGNWGVADLSPGDLSIATDKGWTVITN
jgi:hypothetical protein